MPGSKVVITTFKNEAPYILEWVAHYRALGFDHLVVYTNDCTDGTNRLLRRLEEMGELSFHINKVGAGGVHRSALRQARRLDVVKQAEWIFVCDIDEFLNIHVGDHTVDALIEASDGDDIDAIAIPWKLFSNNGRSLLRRALITEQFTDAELPPAAGGATRRFIKTIFRQSDKIGRVGLHAPAIKPEFADQFRWATPGGARVSDVKLGGHVPAPFGYDTAQLNHYAVRSVESYLLKKFRGRANHMRDKLGTEYWDRWNRGGSTDETILRYLPAIQAKMEAFAADETLTRLNRKGFQWHKDLAKTLAEDPEYQEVRKACEARLTTVPPIKERPAYPVRPAQPLAQAKALTHGLSGPTNRPHIGSLWIGTALSYVEQMCLLSFVRQGHPVTLFTYGAVRNIPGDVNVVDAREIHEPTRFLYSKFGTPVVQSDVFRLQMLAQTDMIWADSDMVCLQPIEPDEGHVHGKFTRTGGICNALLRLPKDSPALAKYLAYVSDPYPIPPWMDKEARAKAEALKSKEQWKHASSQSHDIFGPPALSHFLRETGEVKKSRPVNEFYPVAFKALDVLIEPSDVETSHFTSKTRAVHLWARRLRWRLPQLGLQEGSFIYKMLTELEINPNSAPLPEPSQTDLFAPMQVYPRTSTVEQIVEKSPVPLNFRQQRAMAEPRMDAQLRYAEHVLKTAEEENLFGVNDPLPKGRMRGITDHGTDAYGAFRLACSIDRYTNNYKRLPDLLQPTDFTEKLILWKHFGAMPIPTPADKLTCETFVPKALHAALRTPERPWVSDQPETLPRAGEIADGVYYLKHNHSHGARKLVYPLSDTEHEAAVAVAKVGMEKEHGFWASEWWYSHIPRKAFLERHLDEGASQDVPDWKFWTFGGKVSLVQVDLNRSGGHVQLLHKRDLTFLPHELYYRTGSTGVKRPEAYDRMVDIAEAVGQKLDFARVDLYATEQGITLGEITICPTGASQRVRSKEIDTILSKAWGQTAFLGGAAASRAA